MHDGYCFLCHKWGRLEEHHIFGGPNRKKSTKYGLVVYLHGDECHRNGKKAAHRNPETRQMLHEYGQRKWMEETGGTVEDFVREFGRNYLDVTPGQGQKSFIDSSNEKV